MMGPEFLEYAFNGYLVSPFVATRWNQQVPELKNQPGFAQTFLPGGRAPRAGERFVHRDAAATLELIAETRGKAFYAGELAERIASHSAACEAASRYHPSAARS